MAKITQELFDAICDDVASGKTLSECLRTLDILHVEFWKFKQLDENRNVSYARARELQAEAWADSLIEIADETSNDTKTNADGSEAPNGEWMQRSKLKVETRKWLMSKNHVGRYGDKVSVDAQVTHGADAGLLAAIRGRNIANGAAKNTLTSGDTVEL
jgi:hypothetical protein